MGKRAKVVIAGTAYRAGRNPNHDPQSWLVPEFTHATINFQMNGPIGNAALIKPSDGSIDAVVTFSDIDPELLDAFPYLGIAVDLTPGRPGEVLSVAIVSESADKELPRYTATVEYLDDEPDYTPMPRAKETIPLESLCRLDLRPGDTLAIVAPTSSMDAVRYLQEKVQQALAEWHPGTHLMVFPEGTDLSVLPKDAA